MVWGGALWCLLLLGPVIKPPIKGGVMVKTDFLWDLSLFLPFGLDSKSCSKSKSVVNHTEYYLKKNYRTL